MSSQINILQNRINEQDEHFAELERQLTVLETRLRQNTADLTVIIADASETSAEAACMLRQQVDEQVKRIEKLEAETHGLTAIETTKALGRRVAQLEAALRDVARCLVDGKVDVDVAILGTSFHSHRILGAASVQTMVEVYHRLKAQMGDPGYDTP